MIINKYKNHGEEILKKGKNISSRGYCGYFTKKSGERIYLRSRNEFVVACVLEILNKKYKTEQTIYKINDIKYKPDFFIYKGNDLRCVVEVKYSKKERKEYLKKFKRFFNMMGVSYIVLEDKHIRKLIRKFKLKEKERKWIKYSIENENAWNMMGKNNPSFGLSHTDETKKIISEKMKLWHKQNKQEFKNVMKKAMNKEETKLKISKSLKKYNTNHPDRFKKYKEIIKIVFCPICKNKMGLILCYDKNTNKFVEVKKEDNRRTCSEQCYQKYRRIKYSINRKKIRKNSKKIALRELVKYYKENNSITREIAENILRNKTSPFDIRILFGNGTKMKEAIYGEIEKSNL